VVISLEQGADLHMAQLMPLPLTVSCFGKIQTDFTFLVPAYLGSRGQRAVKRVCVLVCAYMTSPRRSSSDHSIDAGRSSGAASYLSISAARAQAAASGRVRSMARKKQTSSMSLRL